jgi:hypothetical protein
MQPFGEHSTGRHDVRQVPAIAPVPHASATVRWLCGRGLKPVAFGQCTGLRATPEREVVGDELEV